MVYRKDIDGLRAIAILVVLFFHAGFSWMPGGFIGVDIFFVLSGFLITTIIQKEVNQGSFRLSNFYNRRIKRLMPAFILVLFTTTIVSYFLLIPDDLNLYSYSLAASISGVSNIFFSLLSGGYFSPRTDTFPLLHTWSLSVEEQFYVFWPTALVLLLRKRRAIQTCIFITFLFVFSLFSIHSSIYYPNASYYLPHNRAIELLIGALVALYSTPLAAKYLKYSGTVSMLSFLGLLYMACTLTEKDIFPGINAIVISILTAFVIIFNKSPQNALNKVLSSKIFVCLGLISYSLYLWHWPIFALLRYRLIEITPIIGMLAIGFSILLASATYLLIENPIRRTRHISLKFSLSYFYILPLLVIFSFTAYVYASEGIPTRFPLDIQRLVSSYSAERNLDQKCSISKTSNIEEHINNLENYCTLGLKTNKPQILLFGDSHANHFKRFVAKLANDANMSALYSVRGSCSSIDGLTSVGRDEQCVKRNKLMLSMSSDFDFVVLASAWRGEKNMDIFANNLEAAVSAIVSAGATPILFIDNPSGNSDYSRCKLHQKLGWIKSGKSCDIPKTEVNERHLQYDLIIKDIISQHSQAKIVDTKALLCNDKTCSTTLNGLALYRDSSHLNEQAAQQLAIKFLQTTSNPFTNKAIRGNRTIDKD